MDQYLIMLLKLVLSVALGALIGFERESKNRPAGLRTNILVCLGATLVQIVSIDIFYQYKGIVNIDPARLGAQVISGIGFLGAGTIMREGASIKGLTTAAGLWVVACIGLAIGNGSYIVAIAAAALAYMTLTMLRGVESRVTKKSPYYELEIQMENKPGQIGRMGQLLGGMGVNITNIEFKEYGGELLTLYVSMKVPQNVEKREILKRLMVADGVFLVNER